MTVALRPLGSSGLSVFPVGLGCMGMSDLYGPADGKESVATIHAALDAGINLFEAPQRCVARTPSIPLRISRSSTRS